MSNAEEATVAVERDGVQVEKSFEPDDFPVPAIAFVVHSERGEPVEIRLADRVPEDVAAEDIGFHPQYGAEYWSVEDGRIVFEREFEAGEQYTTVYGLRANETDDVERYMSEPDLERVDPELDSGEVVADVIGDAEADADDGGEGEGEGEADDEVEPLELNDPVGESGERSGGDPEQAVASVADEGAGEGTERGVVEVGDESVVAALAAEIRAGDVDDDDLAALRDALGVEREGGSVDARISRLQSDIADLQAYSDALEEFLEEDGDTQTLLRELQGDIADVESEIESVRERADANTDSLSEFDAELTELEATVSEVDGRLDDLAGRLDDVEGAVGDVREEAESAHEAADDAAETAEEAREDAAAARETADDVEGDVETIHEDLDDLHVAVDEASAEVEETAEEVSDLADDVAAIEADVGEDLDERLSDVEEDVRDIREELADLAEMRDRMASVFGARDDEQA